MWEKFIVVVPKGWNSKGLQTNWEKKNWRTLELQMIYFGLIDIVLQNYDTSQLRCMLIYWYVYFRFTDVSSVSVVMLILLFSIHIDQAILMSCTLSNATYVVQVLQHLLVWQLIKWLMVSMRRKMSSQFQSYICVTLVIRHMSIGHISQCIVRWYMQRWNICTNARYVYVLTNRHFYSLLLLCQLLPLYPFSHSASHISHEW